MTTIVRPSRSVNAGFQLKWEEPHPSGKQRRMPVPSALQVNAVVCHFTPLNFFTPSNDSSTERERK